MRDLGRFDLSRHSAPGVAWSLSVLGISAEQNWRASFCRIRDRVACQTNPRRNLAARNPAAEIEGRIGRRAKRLGTTLVGRGLCLANSRAFEFPLRARRNLDETGGFLI